MNGCDPGSLCHTGRGQQHFRKAHIPCPSRSRTVWSQARSGCCPCWCRRPGSVRWSTPRNALHRTLQSTRTAPRVLTGPRYVRTKLKALSLPGREASKHSRRMLQCHLSKVVTAHANRQANNAIPCAECNTLTGPCMAERSLLALARSKRETHKFVRWVGAAEIQETQETQWPSALMRVWSCLASLWKFEVP